MKSTTIGAVTAGAFAGGLMSDAADRSLYGNILGFAFAAALGLFVWMIAERIAKRK